MQGRDFFYRTRVDPVVSLTVVPNAVKVKEFARASSGKKKRKIEGIAGYCRKNHAVAVFWPVGTGFFRHRSAHLR